MYISVFCCLNYSLLTPELHKGCIQNYTEVINDYLVSKDEDEASELMKKA